MKMQRLPVRGTGGLAIALALCAGCNPQGGNLLEPTLQAARNQAVSDQLKLMGLAFHNYHDIHREPPSNWDDFLNHVRQSDSRQADALEALRDQGVTVHWGVSFRDATVGSSNFVLAYPPATAQGGGVALMLDGAVRPMSAAEFQQALQAQASIKPTASSRPAAAASSSSGGSPSGAAASASSAAAAEDALVSAAPSGAAASEPPRRTSGRREQSSTVGPPVEADTVLKVGDRLYAEWGNRWEDVEVLSVAADGTVTIRWLDWGTQWDGPIERRKLRLDARAAARYDSSSAAPEASPDRERRIWTDSTGRHKTDAEFVSFQDGKVTLRNAEGQLVVLPMDRLSEEDRKYVLEVMATF